VATFIISCVTATWRILSESGRNNDSDSDSRPVASLSGDSAFLHHFIIMCDNGVVHLGEYE